MSTQHFDFWSRIPVRLRLAIGHSVWMAIVFCVCSILVKGLVERQLLQSVDAALLASARSVRENKALENSRQPDFERLLAEFFGERYINAYAQIVDLSGKIRSKSETFNFRLPPMTENALRRAEEGLETFETFVLAKKRPPVRQLTLPILNNGLFAGNVVQVAAPLDSTYAAIKQLSDTLLFVLPILILLSFIFGYILASRSLSSVNEMQEIVATIGSDDLSSRLSVPRAHDELRNLAQTFNGLLDRLNESFIRLRRFSADVAHELRTPLAVLRGEAELALRKERTNDEYRLSLETIATEAKSMGMTIEDLLLLAKADAQNVVMDWREEKTAIFIDHLVASVKSVFEQKEVSLNVTITSPESFWCSANYLSIALRNILFNAAKHAPKKSEVTLKVNSYFDQVSFTIKDIGEGIPSTAIPYIFDPFYRVDSSRNRSVGGFGIGLSMAKAMARLHRGTITVESGMNQGTSFQVCIPKNQIHNVKS